MIARNCSGCSFSAIHFAMIALFCCKAALLGHALHLPTPSIRSATLKSTFRTRASVLVSQPPRTRLFEYTDNDSIESIYTDTDSYIPDVGPIAVKIRKTIEPPEIVPKKDSISAPNVRKILSFAIPAIGVWLCNPLLSMIDTSIVGLFGGTAQQAALNPAVAVSDYSARCLSFLFIGTTNMIASALEEDKSKGCDKTERTFVGALQLSLIVGSALGAFLILFSRQLLRALIGNDAIDPEIMNAALRYVQIRALGMPASAMIGSAQAACLGMQDVKSPLKVLAAAAILNFVFDLCLVGRPQMWLGGAAGAAWATSLSQYIALGLFLRRLGRKKDKTNGLSANGMLKIGQNGQNGQQKLSKDKEKPRSTKGILAGKLNLKTFLKRPSAETTEGFRPYVVPVTVTEIGRCSTYVAMGHVVSSSFGALSMAAHQIIISIFYCLTPFADSLSLTAQSFLPGILAKEPSHERTTAVRQTTMNLLKVAGIFGLFLSSAVACVPFACPFFTTDPAVMALVSRVVPILVSIFSLHGFFCATEGVLLGQRDLKFLGRVYGFYFVVMPLLMLRLKTAVKGGAAVALSGLNSVWNLFLYYQVFRISVWSGRVVWQQRKLFRADKKAEATSTTPISAAL